MKGRSDTSNTELWSTRCLPLLGGDRRQSPFPGHCGAESGFTWPCLALPRDRRTARRLLLLCPPKPDLLLGLHLLANWGRGSHPEPLGLLPGGLLGEAPGLLEPLVWSAVRKPPRRGQATLVLSGDAGERPPLLLLGAQTPPTVIKITSFCYNLNIPTSHKGLYYTRVTPGPCLHRKAHGRSPLLTK